MKKLRNIFAALSTLGRISSTDIEAVWRRVKSTACADNNLPTADIMLIDSILAAVISIAKDDEDKVAAPSKDGK
jgi:hypothetical protein